jgi:hypothetical protein
MPPFGVAQCAHGDGALTAVVCRAAVCCAAVRSLSDGGERVGRVVGRRCDTPHLAHLPLDRIELRAEHTARLAASCQAAAHR